MKKLIGSALLVVSAVAASPLLAHPGERGAMCGEGANACPQSAEPRGPQAMMNGGMGRGMGMGGGMRPHMAMNSAQGCPMMQQNADKPGVQHNH